MKSSKSWVKAGWVDSNLGIFINRVRRVFPIRLTKAIEPVSIPVGAQNYIRNPANCQIYITGF